MKIKKNTNSTNRTLTKIVIFIVNPKFKILKLIHKKGKLLTMFKKLIFTQSKTQNTDIQHIMFFNLKQKKQKTVANTACNSYFLSKKKTLQKEGLLLSLNQ